MALNFANDEATVVARIVAIAAQSIPDDGVEYRTHTVTSRVIRDEDLYSGVLGYELAGHDLTPYAWSY